VRSLAAVWVIRTPRGSPHNHNSCI
jgi:hypothetical protein